MKRIIMMLTVSLIMAAMMMVSAASAFAHAPPLYPPGLVGTPFLARVLRSAEAFRRRSLTYLRAKQALHVRLPMEPRPPIRSKGSQSRGHWGAPAFFMLS
jgi:hypothetical protein